jgi:uncharacterized repeat protein (TIGR03803 family)
MRRLHFGRCALGMCVGAAMLAGCGGGTSTPLSPLAAGATAERTDMRPAYSLLHSFGSSGDGTNPYASLLNVKGTLYGTTEYGGANRDGTIFSITTSGTEKVLYSFQGGADGSYPEAGLLNVKGTLYGTTDEGGADCSFNGGCGTVFSITPSGAEKVLYRFKNDPDGAYPVAGLVNVKGTLYGTTTEGGVDKCDRGLVACGTVFRITTEGKEKVLHSFGSSADGANPWAGLINVNGMLYGTTAGGGANYCGSGIGGCGTVFSITPSGTETVRYSFKGAAVDGDQPTADLVNVNGILYGTTQFGAARTTRSVPGYGTVFSVTTSGTEKVLYSFNGGDGADPVAGLVNFKGTLYGTTEYGGANGTVFSITPSGTVRVLYSFQGNPDGAYPVAGLVNVHGKLYGTTWRGGAYSCGSFGNCGTVFSLSP